MPKATTANPTATTQTEAAASSAGTQSTEGSQASSESSSSSSGSGESSEPPADASTNPQINPLAGIESLVADVTGLRDTLRAHINEVFGLRDKLFAELKEAQALKASLTAPANVDALVELRDDGMLKDLVGDIRVALAKVCRHNGHGESVVNDVLSAFHLGEKDPA